MSADPARLSDRRDRVADQLALVRRTEAAVRKMEAMGLHVYRYSISGKITLHVDAMETLLGIAEGVLVPDDPTEGVDEADIETCSATGGEHELTEVTSNPLDSAGRCGVYAVCEECGMEVRRIGWDAVA